MDNPEFASYEKMLNAYPDISVFRDVVGYVTVTQDLGNDASRRMSVRDVYSEDNPTLPTVGIGVISKMERGENKGVNDEDLYFELVPDDQGNSTVEVKKNESGLEVPEVLKKVRQGFEIFSSYLREQIGVSSNRVYDELAGRNVEADLTELYGAERARAMAAQVPNAAAKHIYLGEMVRNAKVV